MKHYLITYKNPNEPGYLASRVQEIIEAQSDAQAHVNASHKAKRSQWDLIWVEELEKDQVDIQKKKLKDRRKLRHQSKR